MACQGSVALVLSNASTPRRSRARGAIVFKTSTLLGLHRAMIQRNYRLLFSPKRTSLEADRETSPDPLLLIASNVTPSNPGAPLLAVASLQPWCKVNRLQTRTYNPQQRQDSSAFPLTYSRCLRSSITNPAGRRRRMIGAFQNGSGLLFAEHRAKAAAHDVLTEKACKISPFHGYCFHRACHFALSAARSSSSPRR